MGNLLAGRGSMGADGVYSDPVSICAKLSFFVTEPGIQALLFLMSSIAFVCSLPYLLGVNPWHLLTVTLPDLWGEHFPESLFAVCPYSAHVITCVCICLFLHLWKRAVRHLAHGYALPRRFTDPSLPPTWMKDKVAVVTGGNAGIGMETTRQLALWGVHVLVGCRRVEDVQKVADIVSQEHASNKERAKRKGQAAPVVPGEIHGFYLDLCDFDSVRRFAGWAHSESRGKIDILMNNAGLMSTDKLTMDKNTGFERHFVTNQLGPFLLTDLLLPAVKAAHGRIITISSAAHVTRSATFRPLDAALSPQAAEAVAAAMGRPLAELQGEPISEKNYDSKIMYGTTKMANIWFTKELQRRLAQDPKCRVTAYAAHPGLVRTGLMLRYSEGRITWYTAVFEAVYSMIAPLVLKTVRQGAATQLLLCVSDKEELEPGAYYKDGKANWVDYLAHDLEKQKELWEVSEIVCGLR